MYNHEPPGYVCPFCRIVSGEDTDLVGADHVVERTPTTVTFISPKWWAKNPGAVLVVPAAHHENIYDLPATLGADLHVAVRNAALAMKHAYRCDGTSTRQHNEPAGYQDVWHYHVHVFPRYVDDNLYGSSSTWTGRAEMASMANLLRSGYQA